MDSGRSTAVTGFFVRFKVKLKCAARGLGEILRYAAAKGQILANGKTLHLAPLQSLPLSCRLIQLRDIGRGGAC